MFYRRKDGGEKAMDIEYFDRPNAATSASCEAPANLLLREGRGAGPPSAVIEKQPLARSAEETAVFCRTCGHPITTARQVVAMDGSQTHTFFNPAGIIFEIICYTGAPGCAVQGAASSTFSWFAGFTWRVALCGGCLTHLGWLFESGSSSFFGLILQKLAGDL